MLSRQSLQISQLEQWIRKEGLVSAKDAARALSISQASFSRAIKTIKNLLRFGNARSSRYTISRLVAELPSEIPIYQIDAAGKSLPIGTLYPTEPKPNFVLQKHSDLKDIQIFKGLPYFIDTLKIAGFLGRFAMPTLFQGKLAPPRMEDWSDEYHLHYLLTQGWDRPGNLILGNSALDRFREVQQHGHIRIEENKRKEFYPKVVANIGEYGNVGSSAGGEQPKFAITLETSKGLRFLIVKYCTNDSAEGERARDMLIAEHLALETLRKNEIPCSISHIFEIGKACFLEIERFDRIGDWGRVGYSTIGALNAELVGASASNWSDMAEGLYREKLISPSDFMKVLKLDSFGSLIANTDRHMGNLSFFFNDLKIGQLTPVYDMLPMAYMPRNGQIFTPQPKFSPPSAGREDAWLWAYPLALEYWDRLSKENRISSEFRKISTLSLTALKTLRESLILE